MLRNSTLIMFASVVFVVTNASADPQRVVAASMEIESKALLQGEPHEAFAVPAIHTRQCGRPIQQAPPKPLHEQPPNHGELDNQFTWVPGYWSYAAGRSKFVWITGGWRKPPPDQRWLDGYWHHRTDGYVWIPSAWIDTKQEALYFPRPPQARRSHLTGDLPADRFYVAGAWRFADGGYAWTTGKVTIEVAPYDDYAQMPIKFAGRSTADTTGYTGPVAINTTSWTDFESLIDVDIDSVTGFKARAATVTTQSASHTTGIVANRNGLLRRIIRRATWRRLDASRPQADAITRRDTSVEVQVEFTRSMTEELATISHASTLKELLPGLLTADVSDHQPICSTDHAIYLCVGGHHCKPPELPESTTSNPVKLWVHNSILSDDTQQLFRAANSFGSGLSPLTPTRLMSSSNLLTKLADRVLPFDKVEEVDDWTVLTLKPAELTNALAVRN